MKTKFLPIEYKSTRKKYVLFKNDCGVSDVARWGSIYESHIYDYIKKNINVEGSTIIDIGANFGFHSLEFADLVGDMGKVFAFEPQRLVYYQLCSNIILNGYDNILAFNVALGNEKGKTYIETPNYYSESTINIGDTHTNKFCETKVAVDINTLDDYELINVSVIKIDVQGYEPYVLDGSINTIIKYKPVIFIEIEPPQLQLYNFDNNDVIKRLEKLNYVIEKFFDFNYIFIPKTA